MGNVNYRTPCPYNTPCLYANKWGDEIVNNFYGDYESINSNFGYDLWEAHNSENTTCEYVGAIWTCNTESVKDNFYY